MLDCNTPRGEIFMDHQRSVQAYLESRGCIVYETGEPTCPVDILICREVKGQGVLTGIAEIKCRDGAGGNILTVDYLKARGGCLVLYQKLKDGASASFLLGVPYFFIIKVIHEGVILIWQVTNTKGEFLFDFNTTEMTINKSCNGGETVKINAFLPIEKSTYVKLPQ